VNPLLPVVVWLLIALVGLAVTLVGLRDALGDLAYLEQAKLNGARRLIARGNVRLEAIRSAILALFAAIGVAALFLGHDGNAALIGAITAALIVASALLVASSILDRRDRAALIKRALLTSTVAAELAEQRLAHMEQVGADTNATAHRVEDALQQDGDGD
jgi:hypothetical protein